LNSAGQKDKTNVYAGGNIIAEQQLYAGGAQGLVWKQSNPVTGTEVEQHTANGLVQKIVLKPLPWNRILLQESLLSYNPARRIIRHAPESYS